MWFHVELVKGLKGTVVNQAYPALIRGSLEITTRVLLNLLNFRPINRESVGNTVLLEYFINWNFMIGTITTVLNKVPS